MKEEISVLMVEDSADDAVFVTDELEKGGLKIHQRRVDTARDMKDALTKEAWDIILCDYSIPGFGAIPALALLKEMKIDTPVIITSGVIGEDTAVAAMKAGAHDFIVKGNYARLVPAVRREIEEYTERKEKETEAAKQKHEAEKQRQLAFTMIMQNPQPLLIVDTKFHIKLANEAFLTLSGFTEEHLQKMSIRDFKILNKSGHNIKEALETKKGVTGNVTVQFPAAIHNLEQHTIPLLDKEGEIVSIMAVYNDLTEKLAEEAKREELANYITAYLSSMADNLTKLAHGNLDFNLEISPASKTTAEARDWFLGINKNLDEVKSALDLLISDANMLSKAAVEGKLDTRADASKHHGDYHKIIDGVNNCLDAVIGPLNVAAEYVDRISKGDMPAKITDKYNGDFNEIKNNLNNCIDNINALVSDANLLAKAAVDGKLDTRADASKHLGDYRKIVQGVDDCLDAVIGPLNVAAEYVDRISKGDMPSKITDKYNGDFNEIKNNLNNCIDNINALTADANMLAKAAVEGKLKTRADASRHQGDYRKIVEGVNSTLDSVIAPVNEALRISIEYAKCNFAARVDQNLHVAGDFQQFKDALNNIGIEVSKAVVLINQQVTELAGAARSADGGVNDVSAGAAQIARNTGQVSANAEKSNLGVEQVLKAMSDLSSTVEEVASSMESVAGLAKNTDTLSADGVKLANKANQSMGNINDSTKIVDTNILEINNKMKEIGKIVKLIRDIANQTNLLALNAAIEAARAGDAGRGFAVVAAEVKSLAQESRGSAENIAAMIEDLQKRSQRSAEAVVQASQQVAQGSKDVEETLAVFNKIVESVAKISQSSSEVAAATEEQAASVEEITASVHEVSGLIQGTTKEAGDAAAATQEASAALDEITKVVGKVNSIVANVSSEMTKFRV